MYVKNMERQRATVSRSQVKSARRVLELFELFDKLQRPLAVSEIARFLGYPMSSTSVMVRDLTDLGYLTTEPGSRRLHPTLRIAMFGDWISASIFGRTSLHIMLEELHHESGEIVILSMRNGPHLQYIHIVEGGAARQMDHRIGNLRPLFDTASGLVILSALPPKEIGKLVRRFNTDIPSDREPLMVEEVLERARSVRESGYALLANRVKWGHGSVAMALPVAGGSHAPMAVSISAPVKRLMSQRDRFVAMMRDSLDRHVMQADR
jgi:DNA-binding IclR family transcriptional regulator